MISANKASVVRQRHSVMPMSCHRMSPEIGSAGRHTYAVLDIEIQTGVPARCHSIGRSRITAVATDALHHTLLLPSISEASEV